ncbi:MAG: hypothetical protein R3F11_04140 [Verrucomicrobiales bacterium]
MAAAVYTQTTDVEGEVNGLMTYDREVVKFDPEHMRKIHARSTPSRCRSMKNRCCPPANRRGTRGATPPQSLADGWEQPGFDDAM